MSLLLEHLPEGPLMEGTENGRRAECPLVRAGRFAHPVPAVQENTTFHNAGFQSVEPMNNG